MLDGVKIPFMWSEYFYHVGTFYDPFRIDCSRNKDKRRETNRYSSPPLILWATLKKKHTTTCWNHERHSKRQRGNCSRMLDIGSIWELLKIKHTLQLTKEKSDTLYSVRTLELPGIASWRALPEDWSASRIPPSEDVLTESFSGSITNRSSRDSRQNEIISASLNLAVVWNEDTFRHSDHIAHEDNSCIATWNERQLYEKNWKFADRMLKARMHPWHREDNSEADKAINDLRQKDEQECNYPILQSHQTRQRPFQEIAMRNCVLGPHHLRVHLHGQGRKLGGPLVKWKAVNVIFLQEVSLTGNGDSFFGRRSVQTFSRVLVQGL